MEYRCLLFDLDGTLLRSDKTISPRTLRALEACRERGVKLGISTNRSENRARPFLAILKPEAVISSGGALVRWEELAAFGDDTRDIGMLRLSGLGVAMGNAIPAVKAAADAVIGTNDEDGSADWLEERFKMS